MLAAAAPSLRPHPAQPAADAFAATARSFFRHYGLGDRDKNGPVKLNIVRGLTNYNRLTDQINIGEEYTTDPHKFFDAVAHEYGHRITDKQAGWPGINYFGQSVSVAEGLSDTLSFAVMSLHGTPQDAAWVKQAFDPTGKSGYLGSHYGNRPLPMHMRDYHSYPLSDGRAGHHNAAIVRAFNLRVATNVGTRAMADVVMGAITTDLRRSTNLSQLALAEVRAAERLFGADSSVAAGVRDAARATGFLSPAAAPAPVPA